jgi:hypothetical protein
MTTLVIEEIDADWSARDARSVDSARKRAVDELAGRTVWCAAALEGGRSRADALRSRLDWASEGGVTAGALDVPAREPLTQLARLLESMLAGARAGDLGPAEQELFDEAAGASEDWLTQRVHPNDLVVVHDALSAALARAAREHGAHAIWNVDARRPAPLPAAREALLFLQRATSAIDAYVTGRRAAVPHGLVVTRIVAVTPAAGSVTEQEVALRRPSGRRAQLPVESSAELGWGTLLADVVHGDRADCVGGTFHARPRVPSR